MEVTIPKRLYNFLFAAGFAIILGVAIGQGARLAGGETNAPEIPRTQQEAVSHLKILLDSVNTERDALAKALRQVDPDNELLQ